MSGMLLFKVSLLDPSALAWCLINGGEKLPSGSVLLLCVSLVSSHPLPHGRLCHDTDQMAMTMSLGIPYSLSHGGLLVPWPSPVTQQLLCGPWRLQLGNGRSTLACP